SQPFIHHFTLHNWSTGTAVRVKGLVDDGAMVNVMDAELWPKVRHRLTAVQPSTRRLRMANGTIVPSQGKWTGIFDFNGVRVENTFEVFPSKGAWSFLIGKPLLEALRACHDYHADTITVRNQQQTAVLRN
ncbi:hypothetical protein BV20DRAFT_908972, partial [Pilatotrama ljubarskyi]